MKKEKANRSRFIGLRLTITEFDRLEEWRRQSTTTEISEFIRRVLFGKPITVHQRNRSLDDFMAEMMKLRTELNAIGNNFNQAVKRLHTLNERGEVSEWLKQVERDKQLLLEQASAIKERINQLSDQWLQ